MKEGLSDVASYAIIAVVVIVLGGIMYMASKPRDSGVPNPTPNAAPSVAPTAAAGPNMRPGMRPGAAPSVAPSAAPPAR